MRRKEAHMKVRDVVAICDKDAPVRIITRGDGIHSDAVYSTTIIRAVNRRTRYAPFTNEVSWLEVINDTLVIHCRV